MNFDVEPLTIENVYLFSRDQSKMYRIGVGKTGVGLQIYEREETTKGGSLYKDAELDSYMTFKDYESAYDKLMELLKNN